MRKFFTTDKKLLWSIGFFTMVALSAFIIFVIDTFETIPKVEAQSPQRFQLQHLERHHLNGYTITFFAACDTHTGTLMLGKIGTSAGLIHNGCAKSPPK